MKWIFDFMIKNEVTEAERGQATSPRQNSKMVPAIPAPGIRVLYNAL